MCKEIIDILEKNKNFIKFLDSFVHNKNVLAEYEDYEFVEDKIDIEDK